jgi:hypothetical protein
MCSFIPTGGDTSHKSADIGCMDGFLAPVMLPERLDFFGTTKERPLDKRLIDSGNKRVGISFGAD